MSGSADGSWAARMASAVVLAARQAASAHAGMDRGAFAAYLSAELDTGIPAEELEFWEIGGSMPGDAMLLCVMVIREVLAMVPDHGIPASVRLMAERMSQDLPPLPPDDPIREALNRSR